MDIELYVNLKVENENENEKNLQQPWCTDTTFNWSACKMRMVGMSTSCLALHIANKNFFQ